MHFSKLLAVIAASASLTSAIPVAEQDVVQKHFAIQQVASGRTRIRLGPAERLRTLKKYGAPVPEHVKVAASSIKAAVSAASTQSGSVLATPEVGDTEYLCPVSIGTPAQKLMLDFDTGSADLWVFSGQLPVKERAGHNYFAIANSKTKKLVSSGHWSITYGDSSGASGIVYSDKVVVGPVTATSMTVEAATSVSSEFVTDKTNDGLLGLAASSLNTVTPKQASTFFDTVKTTLPLQLFTANLKHNAPGTYGFGIINSTEYTGAITYTPVTFVNGFWEFTAAGYLVGNQSYALALDAIADTGTTLIYMPDQVLSDYYTQVTGAVDSTTYGGWVFPCTATLPTFSVNIRGITFTVPAAYMNYSPVSASTCFGALQSSDGVGFDILGDIFLKSVYAVFDQGHKRIGFAHKNL